MKRAIIRLLVILGVSCWPGPAQGVIITIPIEGVVDYVEDLSGALHGAIEVGDAISGTYTYDSSTPDMDWLWGSESEKVGRYHYFAAPYGIYLSVGELIFQSDPGRVNFLVSVVNDFQFGDDFYSIGSSSNSPLSNNTPVESISWSLRDRDGTALSSDGLPTMPPVLAEWDENLLRIYSSRLYGIDGTVTLVQLVPEPSAIMLFGVGGLMVIRKTTK